MSAASVPPGESRAVQHDARDDSLRAEIERSVQRIFDENVDAAAFAEVERGEWPQRLWRVAVDAGFAAAPARAAHAGIEASWADAWPILHGIGFWQVPLPLAETMIGAMLLSMADAVVPEGPIALVDDACGGVRLDRAPGEPTLTGQASRVPWARHCRWALVSIRDPGPGGLALVELKQGERVRIVAGANLAGEPCDELAFADARCALRIDSPLPALDAPLRHLAAMARSAAIAGALDSLLAQSVRYAGERVQFGRPIGNFQAIQHALALLAGETVAARTAALVAAGSAPSIASAGASAAFDIAVAKLRCSEAASRGAPIAHQVHGAIGFTREHPLHRATCRLWSWRDEYGSDAHWAEQLGREAIGAGSQEFWPALTRRRFGGR
ncbi:MAG TPA: acyl-CoA dehydrogenase family protein [Zeimonas sp.]|nr:acyl-CoA dehydrogenase family protein [Zeimonas sp.]